MSQVVLRLNPATLSQALGQQLLDESAHIRVVFEKTLWPLISQRLLDPTLQRPNSGSIGLGSALSLFLTSYQRSPKLIAEVGTYIGNSAAALACGSGLRRKEVQLITCDMNPCTQEPLAGLHLPKGSKAQVVQGSSTKMFELLATNNAKVDMLHLDGRLVKDDLKFLQKIMKDDTLIALDDSEGDEKGHINLDVLRRAGLIKNHAFVEPFSRELFRAWGFESRSVTSFLLPQSSILFTRQ